MKNILYIGNKLKNNGRTISSMEYLEKKLSSFANVTTVSEKKSKILRIIDMISSTVKEKDNINLLLIDTFSTKAFYFALLIGILCEILKIRYIPIIRGGNMKLRLKKSPYLTSIYFKNAYKILSPSFYHLDTFKKLGYQIKYLPNSIDIKEYKFKERSKLSPKLLWVRSFDAIYNPQMAIEVIRILKKDYKKIELCMVGPDKDGTLAKCKELSLKYGLAENISFPGLLEKFDWIKLSQKYDIFINTTNIDNLPVSVVEAMALGFPIVSTNAGGLKFLHKNGYDALMGDKNDYDQMASNVKYILKDNNLAKNLSKNARIKAEKYDWYNCVQHQWLDLINVN